MGFIRNINCRYFGKRNGYCENKEVKYPWYSVGRACKILCDEECEKQEMYPKPKIAPPPGRSGKVRAKPIQVEITIKKEE